MVFLHFLMVAGFPALTKSTVTFKMHFTTVGLLQRRAQTSLHLISRKRFYMLGLATLGQHESKLAQASGLVSPRFE